MKAVFVNGSDHVTILCPKCSFTKEIDVTNFKNTKKKLKVKCKCGEMFNITLEFRKHYRKNVMLPGEYAIKGKEEKGEIIIRNLSLTGIQFESLKPHNIKLNDTLDIKFKLDNPKRSEILKQVTVKRVRDRTIGAKYTQLNQHAKDLGFFLQT